MHHLIHNNIISTHKLRNNLQPLNNKLNRPIGNHIQKSRKTTQLNNPMLTFFNSWKLCYNFKHTHQLEIIIVIDTHIDCEYEIIDIFYTHVDGCGD